MTIIVTLNQVQEKINKLKQKQKNKKKQTDSKIYFIKRTTCSLELLAASDAENIL